MSHRTRWTVIQAHRERSETYFLICCVSPARGKTQQTRWGEGTEQHTQHWLTVFFYTCVSLCVQASSSVSTRVCACVCVRTRFCECMVFKVFLLGYFSISTVQLSSQLVAVWSAFSSVCLRNIKERKCSFPCVCVCVCCYCLLAAQC